MKPGKIEMTITGIETPKSMKPTRSSTTRSVSAHAAAIRLLCLLICLISTSLASDLEIEKRLHEELWTRVVQDFEVETRTQANSRETMLTAIQMFEGRRVIEGETRMLIPATLAPHVRHFSYFEIEGEGLNDIASVAYKVAGGIVFTNPLSQTQHLIRVPGSLFADWNAGEQSLVLDGSGVVTGLRLISLEGISSAFDESLFTSEDSTQPPLEFALRVDPRCTLSLDGIAELPVDRFFRLYFSPGGDRSGMEAEFAKKGFLPGRQMVKLAHELETRHGSFREPLLREDPDRKGHADLSIFEQRTLDRFKDIDPELRFAQCLNIWPSFMDAEIPGRKNNLGTPAVNAFGAAAELAAAYAADEIRDSGRSATYWEVKNESDIPEEWIYHNLRQFDGWALLAEFHNQVAHALKKAAPGTRVGGPASAWPRMEMGQPPFSVWKNHRKFMRLTRHDLDFYSHHFYDVGARSSFHKRQEGYEDWLQGRLDCVLDLLAAEMRRTGNLKPLLITEYGTLLGGIREIDYWLRVSNFSSFLIQFMERPADFALTVPFLPGYMHWEPGSGFALVKRDSQGEFQLTKNAYFIDLWEGVGGEYLYLDAIHPRIHALAWKQERRINIALNNQSGKPLLLCPEIQLSPDNRVESICYRLPAYRDGRFQLQRGQLDTSGRLRIGDGETAVIVVETKTAMPTSEHIAQTSHYAHQTALPLSDNPAVEIRTPRQDRSRLRSVTLRIGLQDANGPSGTLLGSFNGHPFSINLEPNKAIKNFFEYVDVPIPASQLKKTNRIRLSLPDSTTILSHAKLTIRSVTTD